MTPEGKVKDAVKKLLKEYPLVYFHMPVQNGMGKPSLDFIGCHNERFFSIETKAPGKSLTLRQQGTVAEMRAARGAVFIIDGDIGLAQLRSWLELTK